MTAEIRAMRQHAYEHASRQPDHLHTPERCHCLACADERRHLGWPPLEGELARVARLWHARDALLPAEDDDPSTGAVAGMAALLVLCVAVVLGIAAFWGALLWVVVRP